MSSMKILLPALFIVASLSVVKVFSELSCYSCKRQDKTLCLNYTYVHAETCPGLPEGVRNDSGAKEVCFKTYAKQRVTPRILITRGCAIQMNSSHNVCDELTKHASGKRARCFLCDSPMCNRADGHKMFMSVVTSIILIAAVNFS